MPRRSVVSIPGLELLRRDLKEAQAEAEDLKALHTEVGEVVVEEGHNLVPELSGALGGTLKAVPSKTAATIRAGDGSVVYAGVIHFGWQAHNIEPVPFLYDAVDRRSEEVLKRYEDGINRITDRI